MQKALKNEMAVVADVDSRQHDGSKGHFIHTYLIKLGLNLNIPIVLGKTNLDDTGTTQLSFIRFETNGENGTLEQFKSFFKDCGLSCQEFQLIGGDHLQ